MRGKNNFGFNGFLRNNLYFCLIYPTRNFPVYSTLGIWNKPRRYYCSPACALAIKFCRYFLRLTLIVYSCGSTLLPKYLLYELLKMQKYRMVFFFFFFGWVVRHTFSLNLESRQFQIPKSCEKKFSTMLVYFLDVAT